jgi:hypothetical protein
MGVVFPSLLASASASHIGYNELDFAWLFLWFADWIRLSLCTLEVWQVLCGVLYIGFRLGFAGLDLTCVGASVYCV